MHDEYSRIVIGTDGSAPSRSAIMVGGAIAARLSLPVTVVTAWKPDLAVPGAREQSWAQMTTKSADVDLSEFDIDTVERVEAKGDAATVLADVAASSPPSLLVVGARGLGSPASRLTGSTANQLSHHSSADVLFVHNRLDGFKTVALATDGSATSIFAAEQGIRLAKTFGAQVILITANSDEAAGKQVLADVARQLDSATELAQEVVGGDAADAIVEAGAAYDLLVIGNRGMSGLARVLGSTANTVTHKATSNLLLVNTTRKTG
ncbi:universal stress protein [Skermania sp. ID1734]|uniref:universal stress protein n=1 Tax=Skermania sp. ID1734 TaxID=2597516 RepID=UPI00117D03A8|nr:universal stress protein [Skermania sp. ID1734]TSD99820.1 universal stress protein [Skermania sp. ID1734]